MENKILLIIFIAITIKFDLLIAQSPRLINNNEINCNFKTAHNKVTNFANYYILSELDKLDINKESQRIPKRKLDSIISTGASSKDLFGKKVYEYNDYGKLTVSEDLEWDSNLNTWVNIFKNESFYDQNNNLVSSLFYQGDQLQWNKFYKSDFEYNLEKRLLKTISYNWEETKAQWIPENKDTLIYNQKNQIILVESYTWNEITKKWLIQFKADEIYNALGQLVMETGYQWEPISKIWINSFRTEWTYHTSGKTFQVISSIWDDTTSDWMYISKTEDIYNVSKQVISYLEYDFDSNQNNWINSRKSDLVYDVNGNVLFEEYATWDLNGLKWNVLVKFENSFNNNYALQDLVIPFTDEYNLNNFHHMLLKTAYFDKSQGNNINDLNELFYYSPIDIVKSSNPSISEFQLFPNPANEQIQISLGNDFKQYQIAIYSSEGKLIQSEIIQDQQAVDLHKIQAGSYYYRIVFDNQSIFTGKLLIQN